MSLVCGTSFDSLLLNLAYPYILLHQTFRARFAIAQHFSLASDVAHHFDEQLVVLYFPQLRFRLSLCHFLTGLSQFAKLTIGGKSKFWTDFHLKTWMWFLQGLIQSLVFVALKLKGFCPGKLVRFGQIRLQSAGASFAEKRTYCVHLLR